jgi:hypothetical protein
MPTDGLGIALAVVAVLIFGAVLGMLQLRLHIQTGVAGKSVTVSLEIKSRWARNVDARNDAISPENDGVNAK